MFTGKKNFASEFVLKTERPPHLYDNNNNNSKNNNNDDNNRHRCLNWNKVYRLHASILQTYQATLMLYSFCFVF